MRKNKIIFGIILAFVVLYSFSTLTTKPKLWYDEGLNIEMAKNFSDFGVMNVQMAPGQFSDIPHILQSTGYTVVAPLSWFFDIFGFGPEQARIYMILWMVAVLGAIYLFVGKMFGPKEALSVVALIATFAPFYGNGRAVMGEIPGLVFLLCALYLALFGGKYFWSGLFFGLAVVSKPSVYITILPAIFVLLLFDKKFFKNSLAVFLGLVPPLLVKILFGVSDIFSYSAWGDMFNLLKNPFGPDVSPWGYVLKNILTIPGSTTVVYFIILFLVAVWARRFMNDENSRQKIFYYFATTYIFFAFLYYLKSPGWLRYLVVAEIFVFILLVSSVSKLKKEIFYGTMALLIGFQFFQLFFLSDLYSSAGVEKVISIVEENFKDKSIGLVNIPHVAVFVPPAQKYQVLRMEGVKELGQDVLSYSPPLDVIVSSSEEEAPPSYELFADTGDYKVYKYKKN